ncbi:MAG: DUF116 domain-containing protein [Dethiobacteria bacterium]|nr:DUF116 domain-containing protein [Bacillota bacterium]
MRPKKRVFLGLLLLGLLINIGIVIYAWAIIFDFGGDIYRLALLGLGGVLIFFALLTTIGIILITISLLRKQTSPHLRWFMEKIVVYLFPFVLQLGKILRIAQDKIQRSFIEVNNQLVRHRSIKIKPERLLLLLPHCLQWSECVYKITKDPKNCRLCGKCNIAALLELCERYHLKLKVATGGTLARKAVIEARPQLVLAVACERDLSSGIIDSFPLPVYGILNERPEGPCQNTRVDLQKVEEAIKSFIITR